MKPLSKTEKKESKHTVKSWIALAIVVLYLGGIIFNIYAAWLTAPKWVVYLISAFLLYKLVTSNVFWKMIDTL
jgi:hypothetical protein